MTFWEQGAEGRKVVIDAGAAVRLKRLERFGGELLTTSGVYAEVRDENAKAMLKTLPVELKVQEPRPEDIAFAKQFAKATGDLGFLSTNDVDLIALTVRLHREAGLMLKDRPAALSVGEGQVNFVWAPQSTKEARQEARSEASETGSSSGWAVVGRKSRGLASAPVAVSEAEENPKAADEEKPERTEDNVDTIDCPAESGDLTQVPEADDVQEEDEESEDGSSAGEWVTEENKHRFGIGIHPDADVHITCATADYSVQNVLLQMGITPLTFDGYAIKSVKLWGLYCRACFHFHRDSTKVFCPKCGNDTVVRVPIIVDQDGVPTVLNPGRKLRTKGTVFSMPKPQGGRIWKPIFAEDEIRIGGRDRELRHAEKLHEKERQLRDPFNQDNAARGWYQRSTTNTGKTIMTSGGGPRMQVGYGRRVNPNANNFRGFKPKKR